MTRIDDPFDPNVCLTDEERAAIDEIVYTPVPPPDWREIRNVTVLRSGICLKNGRILPDSVHDYPHLRLHFAKVAYGSWLRRGMTRLHFDTRYVTVQNLWSAGYFHWITEALPRLMAVRDELADATLLLRGDVALSPVMKESSRLLGARRIEMFPDGGNVRVPRLILPRNPPQQNVIAPETVRALSNHLVNASGCAAPGRPHRKIYISRARSRARRISNEDAVVAHLADRGYERVFMENFSFREQLALMQETSAVVAQHGAGLTNIAFMPAGGRVLELFRRGSGNMNYGRVRRTNRLHPAFARLARAARHRYFALLCAAADPGQSFDEGDIAVDLEALAAKLDQMDAL